MRTTLPDKLERARLRSGYFASEPGVPYGAFDIVGPNGAEMKIIASNGEDLRERWEHVSVSLANRPPNWQEMCFVKNLFWDDEECVVQFHPPASLYVNNHAHCLHLWKPPYPLELPPEILVGIKTAGELKSLALMRKAMREAGLA